MKRSTAMPLESTDEPQPDRPAPLGRLIEALPEQPGTGSFDVPLGTSPGDVDNLPTLVGLIDPQERYLYANDAYRIWYGLDAARLRGRRVADTLPPDLYHAVAPLLTRARSGERIDSERQLIVNGKRRQARATYIPHIDTGGRVLSVSIMVVDITDRYEIESRLARSEAQFHSAFQQAPIGMALVGPDGRWERMNEALCRMLQCAEEALLGKLLVDSLSGADRGAAIAEIDAALHAPSHSRTTEQRYVRADGRLLDVRQSISVVTDPLGAPLHLIVQFEDMTERKAAEEALFREHELAQVTLESIADAVLTTDADGNVRYLNAAAEKLLGAARASARGRSVDALMRLIDERSGERIGHPLFDAIRENRASKAGQEWLLFCEDGRQALIKTSVAPIHGRGGEVTGGVLVIHDVSESRAFAQKMTHYSQHDPVTDLPNRGRIIAALECALAASQSDADRFALMVIDIDRFRQINESLGHEAGDDILRQLARRIQQETAELGMVGRIGGDDFVVLLPTLGDEEGAVRFAERLLADSTRSCVVGEQEVPISLSIGLALFPADGTSADGLLRNAVAAADHAKRQKGNAYCRFSQTLAERAGDRFALERALRRALAHEQFRLHYQPKVDLRSGRIVGTEALIRWQDEAGTWHPPDSFIPVAEESGLIVAIGEWVLREACRQQVAWQQAGLPVVPVAVNVSPLQFHHPHFFETVRTVLESNGLAPQTLELELTEATILVDHAHVAKIMTQLRELGVALSIDDFGTGYSNLSYMKRFPVDAFKIDRSFVRDLPDDADDAAIAQAIVALGRSMGVTVIAEGVETMAQAHFLRGIGCEQGQGYQFSRPVDPDRYAELLALPALVPLLAPNGHTTS
ncbi:sensor domain-containing protein [Chitinasiproducens palmae]|uniref:PAS domain S-box-containing protein/diguanylate cyclase (GGDEF) domain-containing protein n=1 Tax=Chitinasiproducens palmae TaxID=1770053 RepID=A0A1H2PUZ6_9BURK|nr:EAL domain-containing protein [Chitinasiproducens palmae]SDV51041.1 PAS domain S-box-containing protein/diguanylate cyclase (GGDEF) domain-containing protein [Chitinasiproducens palmae]